MFWHGYNYGADRVAGSSEAGLTSTGRMRIFGLAKDSTMAKSNTIQIKLNSSADTGVFYVTKKNTRTQTGKLEFRKYDPKLRKHVAFKEGKIK
jgi:large subunit ribosomal protein L33